MKALGFLFLIFISTTAPAQNCSPINLVTEDNSPFQKIPVYDQDGTGMCYAYTAAQMLDYQLIKRGEKKRTVHPAYMGLMYTGYAKTNRLREGAAIYALLQLIEKGNCSYDQVSAGIQNWANAAKVTEVEILSVVDRYSEKLETLQASNRSISYADKRRALEEAASENGPWACTTDSTWLNLLPKLDVLGVINSPKMLESLLLTECRSKTQVKGLYPRVHDIHNDQQVAGDISNHLKNTRAPVGIAYCSAFWKNPSSDGIPENQSSRALFLDPQKGDPVAKKSCEAHESIIVGQQLKGGKCSYLIRNSWGSGWTEENKQWKCLCKHIFDGSFVDDCSYQKHNTGEYTVEGCWVSQDVISKNAFHMTTIDTSPSPAYRR